ncbi:MAG: DUF5671 domain-containing protein [Actinomycetota bacterium]|nr:DUF5671 domain-containing protein [Actinomycetota bacterium]
MPGGRLLMGGIVGLLILGGITVGIIAAVRRVMAKRETSAPSGDIVAYLLLALAVGTAAFSLAELAEAAFPGDSFISDVETQVATALAGLVVAGPVAWVLWRRQAERRRASPGEAGWVVYLAIIEVVFMTGFAIAAFSVINFLVGDGDSPAWINAIVFAGVILLHEVAVRRSPPPTDGAELYRIIGSAIGLITTSIGLAGLIYWVLDQIYGSLAATSSSADVGIWLAFLIVGAPIWAYRWWTSWSDEPSLARKTWLVITSVLGLGVAIGSATSIAVLTALFLFSETDSAATHFAALPGIIGTGTVAAFVWAHHGRRMGDERTAPIQMYGYAMAAIGLSAAIGAATGLATIAFAPADFINDPAPFVISATAILVVGLLVWGRFWSQAQGVPRELEAGTTPRRLYLVGFAVVTGLVSASALIGTLFVLFQLLISGESSDTLAVQASLFVFSGLATWHLLRNSAGDRDLIESPEVLTPFDVTIICSHPGMIATVFPDEARLRVIYRGDEAGVITDDMAQAIVEDIDNISSIVWVDDTGYRVAPARG